MKMSMVLWYCVHMLCEKIIILTCLLKYKCVDCLLVNVQLLYPSVKDPDIKSNDWHAFFFTEAVIFIVILLRHSFVARNFQNHGKQGLVFTLSYRSLQQTSEYNFYTYLTVIFIFRKPFFDPIVYLLRF